MLRSTEQKLKNIHITELFTSLSKIVSICDRIADSNCQNIASKRKRMQHRRSNHFQAILIADITECSTPKLCTIQSLASYVKNCSITTLTISQLFFSVLQIITLEKRRKRKTLNIEAIISQYTDGEQTWWQGSSSKYAFVSLTIVLNTLPKFNNFGSSRTVYGDY